MKEKQDNILEFLPSSNLAECEVERFLSCAYCESTEFNATHKGLICHACEEVHGWGDIVETLVKNSAYQELDFESD